MGVMRQRWDFRWAESKGRFLNTRELSIFLGIPEGTLRQWRCSGVGPKWHKMRGSVRYDKEQVEEFIHRSERIPSVRANMEETLGSVPKTS
jgi:hypothetical protein